MKAFKQFFIACVLVLCLGVNVNAQYQVLHLKMDKEAARVVSDQSGQLNHAQLIGGLEFVPDRFGNECRALSFDGTGYLTIPHDPSLNLSNHFTAGAWLKLPAFSGLPDVQWVTLICKGEKPIETDNSPAFRVQLTSVTSSVNTASTKTIGNIRQSFLTDEWFYFAVTYDGNQLIIYENGSEVGRFSLRDPIYPNREPLNVGRDIPGSTEFMVGLMDDLKVWDGVLSPSEIRKVYEDDSDRSLGSACLTDEPTASPLPEGQVAGSIPIGTKPDPRDIPDFSNMKPTNTPTVQPNELPSNSEEESQLQPVREEEVVVLEPNVPSTADGTPSDPTVFSEEEDSTPDDQFPPPIPAPTDELPTMSQEPEPVIFPDSNDSEEEIVNHQPEPIDFPEDIAPEDELPPNQGVTTPVEPTVPTIEETPYPQTLPNTSTGSDPPSSPVEEDIVYSLEGVADNNLVVVLDISGSMEDIGKLPLMKEAFLELITHMREVDRISIVTFAGTSSIVLDGTPATSQNIHSKVSDIIEDLTSSGKTKGKPALKKAQKLAQRHFIPHGNNRIILATDGYFNLREVFPLAREIAQEDVHLSVFSFGDYGSNKQMELSKLAELGKGNHEKINKNNINAALWKEVQAIREVAKAF